MGPNSLATWSSTRTATGSATSRGPEGIIVAGRTAQLKRSRQATTPTTTPNIGDLDDGASRPGVGTTSPASSPRTKSREARLAQPVLQDRRVGDPKVRRSERALARAVGRLSLTETDGYKRLTSSATISAAGCARLTSAALCPAHIESASISPVVPTSGAAGE